VTFRGCDAPLRVAVNEVVDGDQPGRRSTRIAPRDWPLGGEAMSPRDTTHNLLRIASGIFFMLHGGQKLFAWFGGFGGTPGATAPLGSLMGVAGILEFYGGTLVALGLLTRPVAFLLAGEMAYAYFRSHFPRGFWPIENRGDPAALYCFIFLFFAANGAGSFSIDALIARARHARNPE
jgi:putative oxidoreductase